MGMTMPVKPRRRDEDDTIRDKLRYLIDNVHPGRARPLSHRDIASMITQGLVATGEPIPDELRSRYKTVAASSIGAIASGENPNPTVETLRSLAWFFGRNLGYFDADHPGARQDLQAEADRLDKALTEGPIVLSAMRARRPLSLRSQRAVAALIEHLAAEEDAEAAAQGEQRTEGGP
jgi:hypothetical protein